MVIRIAIKIVLEAVLADKANKFHIEKGLPMTPFLLLNIKNAPFSWGICIIS